MSFNKVLKRDRKIDKETKDLWARMDLTRDSQLLGLVVEESARESGKTYPTLASFLADVKKRAALEGFGPRRSSPIVISRMKGKKVCR